MSSAVMQQTRNVPGTSANSGMFMKIRTTIQLILTCSQQDTTSERRNERQWT
jgi:hypothetical protein